MNLAEELILEYHKKKKEIEIRLLDFKSIKSEKYFYELCYCLSTPQSKAESALIVQNELEKLDFRNKDIAPSLILSNPNSYIRFHNQKANYMLQMKGKYIEIEKIINSTLSNYEKRDWLAANVKGIGMKESSHFLRNIGYEGLAILDRHILKTLVNCDVFDEIPDISTIKKYKEVELKFLEFSSNLNIPIDHLDLLFWSSKTGKILK